MMFTQMSGYHAYDDDGNLIATMHIDSGGNFIIDNGEEALNLASDLDDAMSVHALLGKLIAEHKGISKPTNILTLEIAESETE